MKLPQKKPLQDMSPSYTKTSHRAKKRDSKFTGNTFSDLSVHRIEVAFHKTITHPESTSLLHKIASAFQHPVRSIEIISVYTIIGKLSQSELEYLGEKLFSDPVIQSFRVDSPIAKQFDWLIEVGYKPGVTDNVGHSAEEAIQDLLGKSVEHVFTSRQYCFRGKLKRDDLETIASDILANQLIERWAIVSNKELNELLLPQAVGYQKNKLVRRKGRGIKPSPAFGGNELRVMLPPPVVSIKEEPHIETINLEVQDDALLTISKERLLALSLDEMKAIRSYFSQPRVIDKRTKFGLGFRPTDVEIEAIAQTWSEHCKHKIFNARIKYVEDGKRTIIDSLFDTYIKKATKEISRRRDWLVSVFKDNAGIIKFNDTWNLVMKVETHNSPSALDPFGGAVTGILGVNRDVAGTGVGAKLLFNTDVFCFASPFHDKPLPPRLMHPKRIFDGVRKGVEFGGNTTGVPTVNGSIVFDERFLGKPLVFCGTGGIMPAKIKGKLTHIKSIALGDFAVMCGGRIGKDGIHGATFSSEELHEGSPVSAVQIGDPITQKKMLDALLEARDLGFYKTLTDNGAGGLSSSVGELAQLTNGCTMYLDKCPLKYPHLHPWEILVSESQERMTVVVAPSLIEQFLQLMASRGVEATVVGEFNNSGMFHALYEKTTVAYLSLDFLHKGVPQLQLTAHWEIKQQPEPEIRMPKDFAQTLRNMLSRLNICSKEIVVRQYDHEVQGASIIKPMQGVKNDGPGDAAIIRPIPDSNEGVVIAHGICSKYSDIDTYAMTACAIDEAIRNAIAVGGSLNHLAGLDNFCWCDPIASGKNPDGDYKLAQLVRSNQALYDYTTAYNVPCISGKDSMKNDYIFGDVKISIPPTLLFSVIGKIENVSKAITMDVKNAGDIVYVLGMTKHELGGSEYYAMNGFVGNSVPTVNSKSAIRLYTALTRCIQKGLVASCHDCSDGGLGVALAESSMAGGFGLDIGLRHVPAQGTLREDLLLFSETQSRFVITVAPSKQRQFERMMKGNAFASIGNVRNDTAFIIRGLNNTILVQDELSRLKRAWQKTLGAA